MTNRRAAVGAATCPEGCSLTTFRYLPHVDLLLRGLRIGRDRLMSSSKIAVDADLLRALLQTALAAAPFDPEFYRATYPDIEAAYAAGKIPDLHQHYVETGYFEGRCGGLPPFDEAFYVLAYRDVARALKLGQVESGQQHYVRSGAAEGRNPSPSMAPAVALWMEVLGLSATPPAIGPTAARAPMAVPGAPSAVVTQPV